VPAAISNAIVAPVTAPSVSWAWFVRPASTRRSPIEFSCSGSRLKGLPVR
jgi:hypothetical protein